MRDRNAGPVDERLPADDAGPSELLADDQRREVVLEAVERLKPEHRAVIVLRYFVDRNYEDMGEILGIDAKTVKSRLYTARQLLKEQLATRGAAVTMDKGQLQELIQADLDGELSVAERAVLARLLLQDPEARRLHDGIPPDRPAAARRGRGRAAARPSRGHPCGIRAVPAHRQFRRSGKRGLARLPHGRGHRRRDC